MAGRFGHVDFRKKGMFYTKKKSSSNKTQEGHIEYDETDMQNADDKLRQRKKYDANVAASQNDRMIILPQDRAVGKYVHGDVLDSKKRRLKAT